MRLLTAASNYQPDKVENLSREFWMRIWSRVSLIIDGCAIALSLIEGPTGKWDRSDNLALESKFL